MKQKVKISLEKRGFPSFISVNNQNLRILKKEIKAFGENIQVHYILCVLIVHNSVLYEPVFFIDNQLFIISAKFLDKGVYKMGFSEDIPAILEITQLYANKKTMGKIGEEMGLYRQQVKRNLQRAMKWFVDNYKDETLPLSS